MAEINSVHDDLFVTMFTNVHEIVHDSFLSFVKRINPVGTLVDSVVEFWISVIFVNNWAILFLVSAFLKCIECSVSLAR